MKQKQTATARVSPTVRSRNGSLHSTRLLDTRSPKPWLPRWDKSGTAAHIFGTRESHGLEADPMRLSTQASYRHFYPHLDPLDLFASCNPRAAAMIARAVGINNHRPPGLARGGGR